MFDDLNDIRLFAELTRHGGITRGAAALGMPPATASRRLKALERELGVRLIERSARRFELTEAGRAYRAAAQHLLDEIQHASRQVAGLSLQAAGHVRIAAPPDFATAFLARPVAAFAGAYPDISIALDLASRRVDLADDGFDLVVRMGTLDDSRWVSRPLLQLTRSLYASPKALPDAPATPADIASAQLVTLEAYAGYGELLLQRTDRPAVKRAIPVQGRITVNSMPMLRQLLLAGAGIGLVPDALMADDERAGRVRRVLPGWAAPPVAAHLLYQPPAALPRRVRLLVEHLVAWFAPAGQRSPRGA